MSNLPRKRYLAWTCMYHTLNQEVNFLPGMVMMGSCSMTRSRKKSDASCPQGCLYGGKIDREKVQRIQTRTKEVRRSIIEGCSGDADEQLIDTEEALRILAQSIDRRGWVSKKAFSADPRVLAYLYENGLIEYRQQKTNYNIYQRPRITEFGQSTIRELSDQDRP